MLKDLNIDSEVIVTEMPEARTVVFAGDKNNVNGYSQTFKANARKAEQSLDEKRNMTKFYLSRKADLDILGKTMGKNEVKIDRVDNALCLTVSSLIKCTISLKFLLDRRNKW